MNRLQLVEELIAIVGAGGVIHRPEELVVYEYDVSFEQHEPTVVVLPTSTAQVAAVVRLAGRAGLPVIPRGAGTGLSGGAIPIRGGIIVCTTRMNRILEIDYRNRVALVEPGVINLDLSLQTQPHGYFFAPDPSSQKASTIGGNIAENSGGPHCLAYGSTVNHVLGLEVVLPSGEVVWLGGKAGAPGGYDLTGVVVGSEGTLGIVTRAYVRLLRGRQAVRTALAVFPEVRQATESVSAMVAAGIVPTALELMDGLSCRAIEMAFHAGYPSDGAAALLIEEEGLEDGVDETIEAAARVCRASGAREVRTARSAGEREGLWAGRKGSLGAFGRLAPSYYIQDGVVPRSKLPEAIDCMVEISHDVKLPIANVAHAGDGNLHPLLLFDRREPGAAERALAAGMETLRVCIALGGTVSGEHGIGLEKREKMSLIFTAEDLAAMAGVKRCFNPYGLFNPDKIFPLRASCAEVRDLHQQSAPTPGESHGT